MSQTKVQLISGTSSQDVTFDDANVNSLNGGPLAGMRNRIINGNFDFWQRGTSLTFSATGPYLADRWAVGGGTSTTVSRQSFTPGQTDVPGEPTYFLRWDITNNSQNYEANQKIEDVRTFAGQQATLSFYARRTSGTVSFNARIVQDFGTGGSPSSLVVTSLGTPSLTTSWQKFTYTVSVPSISGKTLGTDGNSSLWTSLQIGNTGTGVIELAQVQFEAGSVATPFERRSYGLELEMCKRYFQKAGNVHYGITEGTTLFRLQMPLFPVMRTTPSATVITGGVFNTRYSGDTSITTPSVQDVTPDAQSIWIGVQSSGLTSGVAIFGRSQYDDTGNFLAVSAEL